MSPRFWIAAASYLLLTFIIAAGWHLVIFKSVYARLGAFTEQRERRGELSGPRACPALRGAPLGHALPGARRRRGRTTIHRVMAGRHRR